jgi:glucose/arabinose dehydrogenase
MASTRSEGLRDYYDGIVARAPAGGASPVTQKLCGCCRAAALTVVLLGWPVLAAGQLRAELVASGFSSPVAITPDPVTGAWLVVEQQGLVRVIVNGVTQPNPFLDLRTEVKHLGEQGLLGLAFPPDARNSGRVFVVFTKKRTPDELMGDTVVARFRRSSHPLAVDPASRFDLIWSDGQAWLTQPWSNHKGGNLAFGPDGYLYIGLGDGGDRLNAQRPTTLLGKMVRIDVNVPDTHPRGYVVPPGNPFSHFAGVLGEIWAFGYRNPWRYTFDDFGPGATGALVVGDVGQLHREEINHEPTGRGGRNYGWPIREGDIATPDLPPSAPAYLPLTDPMIAYPRDLGATVIGGYVYRGNVLPAFYQGRYFVADAASSRIFSLGLAGGPTGEVRVVSVREHSLELGNPVVS